MPEQGLKLEDPIRDEGYKGETPDHELPDELRILKKLFKGNFPKNLAELQNWARGKGELVAVKNEDTQRFDFRLKVEDKILVEIRKDEAPRTDRAKEELIINGTALNV